MVDVAVEYKAECFRGDRLAVHVSAADPGRFGCDFCYLVTKLGTDTVAAKAKTGILFFDYGTRKPVPMSEKFKIKTGL
ncbi:MAG: thioesterase family protein, partial [Treponemataceae bacterium]